MFTIDATISLARAAEGDGGGGAGGFAHSPVDPIIESADHRQRLLNDHPFPDQLAPAGFRLRSDKAIVDGRETLGRDVTFDGPDDEDTISYYPQAMYADDVLHYWKHTETNLLELKNLGPPPRKTSLRDRRSTDANDLRQGRAAGPRAA